MNKIKQIIVCCVISTMMLLSACGGAPVSVSAEKIELGDVVLNEVEFFNSDKVKIQSDDGVYRVDGEIEALSKAQVSAFGMEGVTHAVVLKFVFDKERTIDFFEIRGDLIKVYSTDKNNQNYTGSLSSILDNEEGEDAFCYLILSASTKEYTLTSKYSDNTSSVIKLKIDARLVTAVSE